MKPEVFAIYLSAALLCASCSSLIFRLYAGLRRSHSLLFGLISGIVAMTVSLRYFLSVERYNLRDETSIPTALGRGLLLLFAAPIAVKLYQALQGQYTHPNEAQPGLTGVRAWLSPGGVILAGLIAAAAWYGFPEWGWMRAFLTALTALLVAPLIHSWRAAATPAPSTPATDASPPAAEEDLSGDRERVLGLLEAGRINAEECTELLNALAATRRSPARARLRVRPSRLAWVAAGALLLALILPWFAFNPNQDMRNMMQDLSSQMGAPVSMPRMNFLPGGGTVYVTGVEVEHGLGWIVILLGLAAAILPSMLAGRLENAQRNLFTLLALGLGSALLLYLVVTRFAHIQLGVGAAVAGFAMLWVQNRQAVASTLAPESEGAVPIGEH